MGGAAGLVASLFITWWRDGYPVPTAPLNGALAGLVAVTAGAHALSTLSALLVGAVGAIVALWVESLLERHQIDDAVGAVPVHLGAGIWGTLAAGIFGRADSLGTDLGRLSQVMIQIVGIGAAALWGFGVCWILFRFIDSKSSLRVSLQHEDEGLNVAEHREPSALLDLVRGIEYQARTGAIPEPIEAESFTEIGQIADQFNTLTTELRSMAEVAEQIADGRLDVEIMPRSDQDTFGLAFRRMVRDLRATVSGISSTATELTSSASALGELANEVEAGVEVQTASISRSEVAFDQVSVLIERLVDEVDILADRTGLALHGLALKMDTDQTQPEGTDRAGKERIAVVEDESDIKHAVQAIQRSANDINMVVDTVRSIAHTTNLLALNANIEAAKAGEHGKAFAIVANEVRDLATETVGSLKDIESIVGRLQSEARGAVGIVDSVVGDVAALASSFGEITTGVNQAAGNLKSQAGEAKDAINSIEEISRHNATAASAFRTLSQTVETEAKNVGDQVTRFSV